MDLKTFKKHLLKNKEFRKEYFKIDVMFEVSEMLVEARIKKGITQAELAKRIGTKQPSIARVENGNVMPSLGFLEKIAKALGTYLIPPRFAFLKPRHPLLSGEVSTETVGSVVMQVEKSKERNFVSDDIYQDTSNQNSASILTKVEKNDIYKVAHFVSISEFRSN